MKISIEQLNQVFEGFNDRRVLVIGDIMMDGYFWGNVDRISPEAPVPIVHVNRKDFRLGGAANVVMNLKSLGAKPIICGIVGNDSEGDSLIDLFAKESIPIEGIIRSPERITTVKTRVLSHKHQIVRIDTEDDGPLSELDEKLFISKTLELLADAEAVIFEDYDKGLITKKVIETIVEYARKNNIPVIVDPKKRNFLNYNNVTLFKPNLRELAEGLKLDLNFDSTLPEIENAAKSFQNKLRIKSSLITLSERGVLFINGSSSIHIPAHVREIYDVSGAGDTVVSVAALTLLTNAPAEIIAGLSNLAGGLVCEKPGVVPIDKKELLENAIREFC